MKNTASERALKIRSGTVLIWVLIKICPKIAFAARIRENQWQLVTDDTEIYYASFCTTSAPENDETKQFNEFETRSHSQLESSNHNNLRTKTGKRCWCWDAGGFVGYVERLKFLCRKLLERLAVLLSIHTFLGHEVIGWVEHCVMGLHARNVVRGVGYLGDS